MVPRAEAVWPVVGCDQGKQRREGFLKPDCRDEGQGSERLSLMHCFSGCGPLGGRGEHRTHHQFGRKEVKY